MTATSTEGDVRIEGTVGNDLVASALGKSSIEGVTAGGNATVSGSAVEVKSLNGQKTKVTGRLTATDTAYDNATSKGIIVKDSEVGSIEVNGADLVQIENVKGGNGTVASSDSGIYLKDNDLGDVVTTSKKYTRVSGNSHYKSLDMTASQVTLGEKVKTTVQNSNGDAVEVYALSQGNLNVDNTLKATSKFDLCYSDVINAGDIDLTSTTESIVQATSSDVTGSLTATNSINLNAAGSIQAVDATIDADSARAPYSSEYTYVMAYGSSNLNPEKASSLSVNSKDATATAKGRVDIKSNVSNNLTATSTEGDVRVEGTVGNDLAVTSAKSTVLDTVTVGKDTVVNSGSFTRVSGNNTFGNDLDINALAVNFGTYGDNTSASTWGLGDGSAVIGNKLTVDATNTIGFASDVTAKSMDLTSHNSSIVQAIADSNVLSDGVGRIITDELTITAPYGAAVALDANNQYSASGAAIPTYYEAVEGIYVPSASASEHQAMEVQTLTSNATLKIHDGAGTANIKTDADVVVDGNGQNDINDLKLASQGNVKVSDLKAVRRDDNNKTGNVIVETPKNVEIGKVVTDTNIEVIAETGNINVVDYLTADNEGNSVGDVILRGKKLEGENFTSTNSTIAIKGANVELTQKDSAPSIVMSNIEATGLGDGNGNVTITIPDANTVDINDIKAINNITVLNKVLSNPNDPARYDVIFDTVKLRNILADDDSNGRGDLNIRAKGLIDADNISGANITLTSTEGNVVVNNAKSARSAEDTTAQAQASVNGGTKSGNIIITAEQGDITIGNMNAASDIIGSAINGNVNVVANLAADAEDLIGVSGVNSNTYGDIILTGKNLVGDNFSTPNSTVTIKGANVNLTQETPVDTLTYSGIIASAVGSDEAGDIVINVPTNNVDLNNIHATKDIVINNKKDANGYSSDYLDTAKLNNVIADSEENGVGDLIIKTRGKIDATDIGGANITLESTDGNITVDGADAHRGNQSDNPVKTAGNINITANSDDAVITIGNVNADTDLIATAQNGTISQSGDLAADADNNGIGDLILTGKKLNGTDDTNLGDKGTIKGGNVAINQTGDGDLTVGNITAVGYNDADGNNVNGDVTITTPNGNVTVDNTKGTHDVTITAPEGKATVTNTNADSEGNGQGTLTIIAKDDVIAQNDGGGNVVITSNEGNVTAEDITADGHDKNNNVNGDVKITANNGDVTADGINGTHDVIITAGGDANVTDAHADTDNDKNGDLIISAGGKAVVDGGTGNNVDIEANDDITAKDINGKDDVTIISDNGTVKTIGDIIADGDNDGIGTLTILPLPIIEPTPGPNPGPNPGTTPSGEVERNLNNLVQEGIPTQIAQSFTPIAFAAEDEDDSDVLKRIVKTVFKTPETGIVTITDRFKSMR